LKNGSLSYCFMGCFGEIKTIRIVKGGTNRKGRGGSGQGHSYIPGPLLGQGTVRDRKGERDQEAAQAKEELIIDHRKGKREEER